MENYDKLKSLLAKEKFPLSFPFKFIGKNTPEFDASLTRFGNENSKLTLQTDRKSRNENHRSLTYTIEAESIEEIVEVFEKISKLPDLLIIL